MAEALADKLEKSRSNEKQRLTSAPQSEQFFGKYAGVSFAERKKEEAISPNYEIVRWERAKVDTSSMSPKKRRVRARALQYVFVQS